MTTQPQQYAVQCIAQAVTLCGLLCLLCMHCTPSNSENDEKSSILLKKTYRFPSTNIPVCWLPLASPPDAEDQRWRQVVREVIEKEYNRRTVVKFTGFGICDRSQLHSLDAVRLAWFSGTDVSGFGPQDPIDSDIASQYFGSMPAGYESEKVPGGVFLNRTPQQLYERIVRELGNRLSERQQTALHIIKRCANTEVSLTLCIRDAALHEVTHRLGFVHEQVRPEAACDLAPRENTDEYDSAIGTYGEVDPYSIMNKCHYLPRTGIEHVPLSTQDIAAINWYYTTLLAPR